MSAPLDATEHRALSVRQPWASAIAAGIKTIELRSWKTNYRGPLLICASKGIDVHSGLWDAFTPEEREHVRVFDVGIAVCVVNLVDCRPMVLADHMAACVQKDCTVTSKYAWVLNKAVLLRPFPVKGRLNLFRVIANLEPIQGAKLASGDSHDNHTSG